MFKSPHNFILPLITLIWAFFLWLVLSKDIQKKRKTFASSKMFARIVNHKPTRRPVYKWLLILISILLLGVALMRPIGDYFEEDLLTYGFDMVIALDLSRSMYAFDIDGNSRIQVAKAMLTRLVESLPDDRIGLVIFAGEAVVQSPLSNDKGTLLAFIERAEPALMTNQGTNIAEAIATSIDRFDSEAPQAKVILLISDGEDPDKEKLNLILDEASKKEIPIFTVGIGSEKGAPIPISQNWFGQIEYLKHQGQTVISKLDDSNLKEIAQKTGGKYFRTTDVASAKKVISNLEKIPRIALTTTKREVKHELYFIPVFLAFFLLILEWMISERIPFEREKDHWLKRL